MKKLLITLMIISISLSVFSCKRSPVNDTGEIILEANKENTENTDKAEENFAPSAETEGVKQDETDNSSEQKVPSEENKTSSEEKETPTEKPIESGNQQLGIEISDEIKKLIDLKDYEYVDENGFVCLKDGVNREYDKYKYIRATREHILVEKGYVDKKEEDGVTKFFTKTDSFTLELDITEEIKEEALYHRSRSNYSGTKSEGGDISVTLEEYEKNYITGKEIIVQGHFSDNLGKHVIHYERDKESDSLIVDFIAVEQYTVIPFTIDKVYGDSDLKAGDTINVRYERFLNMSFRTNEYKVNEKYTFFDTCTEKERSYIASIAPEADGTYSTGAIFQKSELELNTRDYDTPKEFLQAVDEKYN